MRSEDERNRLLSAVVVYGLLLAAAAAMVWAVAT